MRTLNWLWRGLLFFVLFAFALNNQQNATVNFLFGYALTLPLVLVMVPRWWRQRRDAQVAQKQVRHVEQALATGSPRSEAPAEAPAPDLERHKTDPSLPIHYGP